MRFSKNDLRNFKKARLVAKLSDFSNVHIGCVCVYKNQIISTGFNSYKTHPFQMKYDSKRKLDYSAPYLHAFHAEMSCLNSIKNADIKWNKVKLYVYRIRKDRPCGMARPCPACMAAIKSLGIQHIYYTTNNGYSYENLLY